MVTKRNGRAKGPSADVRHNQGRSRSAPEPEVTRTHRRVGVSGASVGDLPPRSDVDVDTRIKS